eukprot:16892-Heterococcus_DN1.PRE.2
MCSIAYEVRSSFNSKTIHAYHYLLLLPTAGGTTRLAAIAKTAYAHTMRTRPHVMHTLTVYASEYMYL